MFKKIIVGLLLFFFLVVAGLVTYSIIYKDKVIQLFITEANKSINTPIQVGKFDFSLLSNFPNLSVSMNDLIIMESSGDHLKELGKAEKVLFNLNIWELFNGNYTIDKVTIINGNFHLRELPGGKTNYNILKKSPEPGSQSPIEFEINRIKLKEVQVSYVKETSSESYTFSASTLDAHWNTDGDLHSTTIEGEINLDTLVRGGIIYGKRAFKIKGDLKVNQDASYIQILSSNIIYQESSFELTGVIEPTQLDLKISSESARLESLIGLFPEQNQKGLVKYRSKGNIYFNSSLTQAEGSTVSLEVNFGAEGVSVFYPDYGKTLDNLNFNGHYNTSDLNDLSSGSLGLLDVKGKMETGLFSGNIMIENFRTYPIEMDLEADLDVVDLLIFYPIPSIIEPKGSMVVDITLEGSLKKNSGESNLKTSGEIELKDVGFTWSKSPFPLNKLNGNFLFNNEDLAISDFSGNWGSSDFLLNGFLKNVLQKIVNPESVLSIEAELKSRYIDLDEMLAMDRKDQKDTLFRFRIPPELGLSFNCQAERIKFRRFESRNTYGNLEVADQRASLNKVSFNIAGGKVDLDAEIDARHRDSVFVYSETAYDRIDIDSIFYIFENFNQNFLVDRHLKGQVFAKIQSGFDFDRYLKLNKNTVNISSSFSIKNGELNDFEPMLKLSKYLNEQKLDHLLFSDLENQVEIKNKTIYLPETEVHSNVTNISIRGTHTFDQKIDYSLKVPLNRNIKPDKDEAFGAVEDDGTGKAMLFLTIRGTTENYKISYDTRAVGKKIVEDFKKEGRELKEIFKNKGKTEEEEVELDDSEFFDFEEDTVKTKNN